MAVPLTTAMQTQIANLYISILGRNPDPVGFGYWCDVYANANGTQAALDAIASGFGKSPEFTGIYSGQTTANAVALMYNNILGRTQDAGGAAYWTGIANGYITSGRTVGDAYALTANAMITAAAANTGTADATLIASKQATAVTAGTAAPSTTYTLGTGVDTVTGSNVSVNGSLIYAAAGTTVDTTSTFNANDSISVSGSNNSLNLTITGGNGATTFAAATINGVQTYNLRNVSGQTNSLDASTVSGLTAYNSNQSTATLTVTNLAAGASAGMIGNGTLTNGALNVGYAAAATAGVLNISGGTTAGAVVISGTGLTSQTINSTGVANTIGTVALAATQTALTINATTALTTGALTNTGGGALTTITVTGAGAVNLSTTALEAAVTTINASAASGALTVALGSNATQTVTGGSGNDVITTGGVLTTGSVNAGAGTGDVLNIGTNVAHVNTSALAAKYTNFEILRLNGSMDMSLFPTFTAVQISGNGNNSITNMTATQAAAVTARATMGANTFALANATGTSDVLSINFLGTTATSAAPSSGIITATGFETINLTSSPGASIAGGANRVTTITGAIVDAQLTNVNLSGTSFTFTDITSSKAVAWNASALTGDGSATSVGLTVASTSGSFAGSVITGSSFRDSITMETTTGLTMNLGAGNDIVSTTTTLLTPSGASTDNTLNGGDGTDQLIFTGAATATDTTFTKVSNFETLQLDGGANNISITGLAAGFTGAFANGVTVTDAANQANAQSYTWSSGLYSGNVTLTHATDATGTATTSNQSITTGSGNDTITLTAANWTGAGVASVFSITTGAGNDTITATTGTLNTTHTTQSAIQINAGSGQDVITVTHVNGTAATTLFANAQFIIGAGASTTTAWDTITGFLKADGTNVSDHLDFATVALNAYTATAAAGYSAAELTVAVSAAGLVTFAGTAAAGLTVQQQINAVQSVVTNVNGDTAFWINGTSTYVFNNATAGDSVVQLIGQTGATSLITTNAVTNNAIFVA